METFFDFNIAEEKIRRLKEYFDGLKTGGKNVYIFGVGGYAEKLNQAAQGAFERRRYRVSGSLF